MNTRIDIRELWSNKSVSAPAEEEIRAKAEKLTKSIRNKTLLGLGALLITIIFILYVWFSTDFQMLSTRIGITVIIFGIGLGVVHFIKTVFLLIENTAVDNSTYIKYMMKLKKQQDFMQTKLMNSYFASLSVGLLLYMYEPTVRMTLVAKLITYTVTFAWIGFNWFYLRPKIVKKQRAKMNAAIESLQGISTDLIKP